jgi:hypothetical protein
MDGGGFQQSQAIVLQHFDSLLGLESWQGVWMNLHVYGLLGVSGF